MTAAPPYGDERLVAEKAVQRAAVLTKEVQRSLGDRSGGGGDERTKADASPVTAADFAAQALLIATVAAAFPADRIVGEESADALRVDPALRQRVWALVSAHAHPREDLLASPDAVLRTIDMGAAGGGFGGGRVWVLDPIDGTVAFLRGGQYAVSLALVEDGEEKVGVLGCPNLSLRTGKVKETAVDERGYGLMLSAVRGQGATIRHMGRGPLQPAERIQRVGDGPAELKDLRIVDSTESNAWWHEAVRKVVTRVGAAYPGTDLWSSHMRYVALIVGGDDVNLRIPRSRLTPPPYIWDHAGIQLIFSEAGGVITDLDGKDIDFGAGRRLSNNRGIIAAKRGIHRKVLQLVQETLAQGIHDS